MKLIFRAHSLLRMFERGISVQYVREVVEEGTAIEEYPDDFPYPSRLMLGSASGRRLHVVAATNEPKSETIIITVYEPDPLLWDEEFKTRRP